MSNSKLTPQNISHIAKLAHLAIKSEEVVTFQKQLSSILEYVQMLEKVSTDSIPETSQVTGLTNVYAEDVIDESRMLGQELALSNTETKLDGYFQVPAVINKE